MQSPDHVTEKKRPSHARHKSLSKHDLVARYFRKDLVGFKNLDLLRCVRLWLRYELMED